MLQCPEDVLSFLDEFYSFRSMFRFPFELIFVYGVRVQIHAFVYEYPVFLTPFVEETITFPLCGVDILIENHSVKYKEGVVLGFPILAHWPVCLSFCLFILFGLL